METNDKGYSKVSHELLEILMSDAFNDTERRVLLFLIRKIYGWNKTSDKISNSQIEKALNLAHSTVSTTLSRLKGVGIIKLVKAGTSKKSPNEWLIDEDNLQAKLVGIAKLVRYDKEKLVGIAIHTKESITKEKKLPFRGNNSISTKGITDLDQLYAEGGLGHAN